MGFIGTYKAEEKRLLRIYVQDQGASTETQWENRELNCYVVEDNYKLCMSGEPVGRTSYRTYNSMSGRGTIVQVVVIVEVRKKYSKT